MPSHRADSVPCCGAYPGKASATIPASSRTLSADGRASALVPASTCRQLSAHHPPPCSPLPQPVRRKHSPLLGILATVKLKPGPTTVDFVTWVLLSGVDNLLERSATVPSPRVHPALRAFARNPVSRTEPCLSRGPALRTCVQPCHLHYGNPDLVRTENLLSEVSGGCTAAG